ncbi:hypothetical protein NtRootA4_28890 [Arthrobacter sp. NtRootA4]|uniref:O-antigen ligase family protein n=1 Tax=Paenarthrobacter sp. TAF1 TaxID=3233067 RepID=UPI001E7F8F15|nr:hypothetical protein NtRootA2_31080 [Arthrobacter sp. NtRootA2]BCW15910.1 hypothetical protein NtRootA4_28890 [Arthrobacter sp. NtRootA4]BCW24243.1 hypothetical protein NtRootC7_31100 [Arthrobacter sp. NtRootC7]BCW28511.1 hypothetical protein NtRootC45_31110 [Arthrobacter sp. NtRootC45]BCW32782.1 hypothetical protein NtRootD5_31130 [Arthrobacter sp. NtRootD5]
MGESLNYVLAGVAAVGVLCMWIRGWLFTTCVLVSFALIYSARYTQTIVPVRVALLAFLTIGLLALIFEGRVDLSRRAKFLSALLIVASVSLNLLGLSITDESSSESLFRYTLLFPLAGLSGFIFSRSGKGPLVARIYVIVTLFMSLLAVVERLSGSFIVAGTYENAGRLVRDGTVRSIVFAEHPLVLSVLLICALPFVSKAIHPRWLCFMAYISIVAGIICTNSRGALVLLGIWVVVAIADRMGLLKSGLTKILKILAAVIAALAFLGLLLGSGSEQLDSSSAVDASAEYRTALYTFAARSLIERPLGWGISGLPEGTYFATSLFGSLDVSKTVDSELALAMFDFGWLGLAAFVTTTFALLRPRRIASSFGQAAFLATASGLYLALHSWTGLGSLWWLLIGLAFGLKDVKNPPASDAEQRLQDQRR